MCIWGPEKLHTLQALISLRSKKDIRAEKLCHYIPLTKKRNKNGQFLNLSLLAFKAETVTAPGDLEESNFCVVPKVFGLV